MKFRTEIELAKWQRPIEYHHRIVSLGSCFANNIAGLLGERKFNITASPTGILFNPLSIASAVKQMTTNESIDNESLIELNGRYVTYDFHSSISGNSREEAIANMQRALDKGGEALRRADHIIITLGTAWVYRLAESGKVVANCHKQPASLFRRELLRIEEICEALRSIILSTSAEITFTVSPVRHIGEGMEDNSLSKALLRVAIATIVEQYPQRAKYFPSYEILIDDLRDYRFYGDDLVHPSTAAIAYIGEKFFDAAISDCAKQKIARIEKVVEASQHRPHNPHSEQYRNFCRTQLAAIAELNDVDLSKEKEFFEGMLQINL
ncbi:MAG: GSCFA domain-containing protein [Alistipes sp.]|nr:GSCFA domain-containing protein [Alistipes sp.]